MFPRIFLDAIYPMSTDTLISSTSELAARLGELRRFL